MTHRPAPASRAVRGLLRGAVAGAALAVWAVAGAASADTPASWEDSPDVSLWKFLLIIFLIPLVLAIVITSLTVLPSLIRGDGGDDRWSEGSWFGGPNQGVEGADDQKALESAGESGGTGSQY